MSQLEQLAKSFDHSATRRNAYLRSKTPLRGQTEEHPALEQPAKTFDRSATGEAAFFLSQAALRRQTGQQPALAKLISGAHSLLRLPLVFVLALTLACSAEAQEVSTPEPGSLIIPNELTGPAPALAPIAQAPALQIPDAAAPAAPPKVRTPLPTMILEMVQSLGIWAIPFALATLIAIWFTTERLVVLRRGRVIPKPFVQRFLKLLEEGEMERDYALQVCEENGSPVAMVFAHGIRKWGKPSVEVEQAIIDGGERQVGALRKHLRVINGVASVSPLIGLLGTVWGMLESFNQIAEAGAMGKTEQLAGGIALALVTTAAGLLIAIPALISYMYLTGRVDALVMEMDELAQRVVYFISAEALAEQGSRPRPRRDPEQTRKRAAV